jgi:hypothetical protein
MEFKLLGGLELSEFITERTIQRIVAGREEGNTLTITNLDGEVRFSIKSHVDPKNILSVSFSGAGFSDLVDRMLRIDTEEFDRSISPVQQKIPQMAQVAVKKSVLPENIDELGSGRGKLVPKKKNNPSGFIKPKKAWTKQDEQELVEMTKSGKSDSEIAKITGRSYSSVRNRRHYHTVRDLIARKYNPTVEVKSGVWSEAELEELVRRVIAGEGDVDIGRAMNRSKIAVRDKRRSSVMKKRILEASEKQQSLELEAEEDNGSVG